MAPLFLFSIFLEEELGLGAHPENISSNDDFTGNMLQYQNRTVLPIQKQACIYSSSCVKSMEMTGIHAHTSSLRER